MNRTVKYIIVLCMCSIPVLIAKLILGKEVNLVHRTVNTLYYFVPVIAVLITEKSSMKEMLRKYKVNFKNVSAKLSLTYILGTTFLFPALCCLCVYIAGSIFQIQSFGQIVIPSGDYIFHGILLPDSTAFRLFALYFYDVFIALIAGLTYNMIFSLGSEVGWRGFLGQNLNMGYYKRNIITGLIWGTWFLPVILFNGTGESIDCFKIIVTYIQFIISSFLLDTVYKGSRSLFVPAAVRGIIESFSWTYYGDGDSLYYGTYGLAGVISLIILSIFFHHISKNHSKQQV